jgi:hypothetical protein
VIHKPSRPPMTAYRMTTIAMALSASMPPADPQTLSIVNIHMRLVKNISPGSSKVPIMF